MCNRCSSLRRYKTLLITCIKCTDVDRSLQFLFPNGKLKLRFFFFNLKKEEEEEENFKGHSDLLAVHRSDDNDVCNIITLDCDNYGSFIESKHAHITIYTCCVFSCPLPKQLLTPDLVNFYGQKSYGAGKKVNKSG